MEQLNGEAGTAVVLHSTTGETLGLVSSPGFDPNTLTLGATSEQWAALENHPLQPLLNRFAASYAPGCGDQAVNSSDWIKRRYIRSEQDDECERIAMAKRNSIMGQLFCHKSSRCI